MCTFMQELAGPLDRKPKDVEVESTIVKLDD